MKPQLSLLILVFAGFSVFASGCPVNVPDVEICADKGKLGAICASLHSRGEVTRRVRPIQWAEARVGMFCMSPEGLGRINATIEKLCQSHQCVEDVNKFIKALKE